MRNVGVRKMVTFETINAKQIEFGNKNFIEVARKKAVDGDRENVFISISRGFFTPDGQRRYKSSFTVPLNEEVIAFIAETIKEI